MLAFVKNVELSSTESYRHFLYKTLSFYWGQQ